MSVDISVHHRHIDVDGIRIFVREGGAAHAPVVLLPHGYPGSSYEFRNLIPKLADRFRLIAPDFPGFGYSDTPEKFQYSFDGYTDFLQAFVERLQLDRFVMYLHDYGSQVGLRLAIRQPQRIRGLIIQNGDIYEDVLGPKYKALLEYVRHPTPAARQTLAQAVSEEGYRDEFLNDVKGDIAARIPPDLWKLHWSLTTEKRREIGLAMMEDWKSNLAWFPRYQAYLREQQPATLIVWGPHDGFMPERSARAYLRDLPNAELHLLESGHWLLETHLDEAASLIRAFLDRTHRLTS